MNSNKILKCIILILVFFKSVNSYSQIRYLCFEEKLDTNYIAEFKRYKDVPQMVRDGTAKYLRSKNAGGYKWFTSIRKKSRSFYAQRSIGHVVEYADFYVVCYFKWSKSSAHSAGFVIYKNGSPMKEFNLHGHFGYCKVYTAKEMILELNNYDYFLRCDPDLFK